MWRPDSKTRLIGTAITVALTILTAACATRTIVPYAHPAPEYAMAPSPDGTFCAMESRIREFHGTDISGFKLLDSNEDGLRWRLALIDRANTSIDVQYYLWYGDAAGQIILKHLLDAARRGVKVRILLDDLNTILRNASTLDDRDEAAAWLDAHPNVQLRLFNPWSKRNLAARLGEGLRNFGKVNQRMHNKALIVDNCVVIAGGRNIGDEYMGLNEAFNFHDIDILGIGPIARQVSDVFDSFWNSEWVVPADQLRIPISAEQLDAGDELLTQQIEGVNALAQFPVNPQSWSAELDALSDQLYFGTSQVYSDKPVGDSIEQVMMTRMYSLLETANSEVLIVNAYIIPVGRGIPVLQGMTGRGVDVTILTNSLASHDVAAVNSHYKKFRKPLLEAGSNLYEMRSDAAIKPLVADTPPIHAKFMGLHSKAMVVDRELVYIGSMNFDPRSAELNSEMGVFIESHGLASALVRLIERDIQPANSWQVELNADGKLQWSNDAEVVSSQPARSWWQRVEDVFYMLAPVEYY